MADGLLLTGAGVVCLLVLVVLLIRGDRAAGQSMVPDWRGWLLLIVGAAAIAAGATLWWWGLFSG